MAIVSISKMKSIALSILETIWAFVYVTLLYQIIAEAWITPIQPDPTVLKGAAEHCNCEGKFPEISFSGTFNFSNAFRVVDNYTVDVRVTNPDLILICRAPYPVVWAFHEYPMVNDNLRTWNINLKRLFVDIKNESTYQFEATLRFKCRPPFQLPRITCRHGMNAQACQTAVVSKPHGSYIRLSVIPNSDATPKPATSRYGENPKCAINLTYNQKTNKVCCSTPNTTFFSRGCSDAPSCQGFYAHTNCTQTTELSNADPDNCLDGTKDLAKFGNAGVVVCKLADSTRDSDSAAIPYFTSLISYCSAKKNASKPPTIYTNLENLHDTADFLEVCEPPNTPIYVTETVTFQCDGSYYHFSSGYRWVIRRRNKPDQILDFKDEDVPMSKYSVPSEKYIIKTIRVLQTNVYFNDTDIYEISCYAPLWDSFEWQIKTVKLDVREPKSISFAGGSEDALIKLEPYQLINCSASGAPLPVVKWETIPDWVIYIHSNSSNWAALQLPNDTSNLDDYIFRCIATQDRIHMESVKQFRLKKPDSQLPLIISVSSVLGILIIGSIFCVKRCIDLWYHRRALNPSEMKHLFEDNPPFDRTKEISAKDLRLGRIIKEGHFGIVREGLLKEKNGKVTKVALKEPKPFSDIRVLKAFFFELKLQMWLEPHPNIVLCRGAQIKNLVQRELYIVNEFCENGSLLDFLRNNRDIFLHNFSFPVQAAEKNSEEMFCFNNLVKWAQDIATGMDFLSSKMVIHMDLAARNILLTQDLTAKIADFGLSHQLSDYIYTSSGKMELPFKWLAPECWFEKQFSVKSDVWSYGITLWEIFSLGGIPYTELRILKPQDLFDELMKGVRMCRPEFATGNINTLIKSCWHIDRHKRPCFRFLKNAFTDIINGTYIKSDPSPTEDVKAETIQYVTLDFVSQNMEMELSEYSVSQL